MNFQGSFRSIGQTDVSAIKERLQLMADEDWAQNSLRRQRYEVHRDTQFIGLVYDEDFRHVEATRRPELAKFADVLQPILSSIAERYETAPETAATFGREVRGYFVRIGLAKLKAGGEITIHRDMNFSLTHSHRVHIPIITNENVWFHVGNEKRNLKEGEIVEINNRRLHYVKNEGDEDRVHMILDWAFPWEPCCCAEKTHPGVRCAPEVCMDTVLLRTPCNCYPEDADFVLS